LIQKQKLDLPSGLVEGGDVDGGALEVMVSRVMVLPSVRWTRSRRSLIGRIESLLLAKRTSLCSSM